MRYWRIKEILNDVGDIGGYMRYRRIYEILEDI